MEANDRKRISQLEQLVDDIAAGLYRIPIGPGAISNKALKPKSVTAGTISVADLESVNAKTGSLTANGTITVNSTGSIAIGKTSYADDSTGGMWVGYSGGTYKLNLGNSTYSMKWDGSALNITGAITAKSGAIGGFSIGPTDLTTDAGATGFASSGGHRLWVGNATPGSAPFRVTNAGVLTASGATITGGITASSLTITGTATFSGGSMTLPNGGSITSSAMDLNQGTLANLTVDGDITVGTGGKIKFGSGAADYLDNNILHFDVGATATSKIEWKRSGYGYAGYLNAGIGTSTVNVNMTSTNTSSTNHYAGVFTQATSTGSGFPNIAWLDVGDGTNPYAVQIIAAYDTTSGLGRIELINKKAGSGSDISMILGDSGGSELFRIKNTGSTVFGVNSLGDLVRPIANDATALGAYYGRVPIYINGTLKYLGVYS